MPIISDHKSTEQATDSEFETLTAVLKLLRHDSQWVPSFIKDLAEHAKRNFSGFWVPTPRGFIHHLLQQWANEPANIAGFEGALSALGERGGHEEITTEARILVRRSRTRKRCCATILTCSRTPLRRSRRPRNTSQRRCRRSRGRRPGGSGQQQRKAWQGWQRVSARSRATFCLESSHTIDAHASRRYSHNRRGGITVKIRNSFIQMKDLPDQPDVARRRGQRIGYLYQTKRSWFVQYRGNEEICNPKTGKTERPRVTSFVGIAHGFGAITRKQAERVAWTEYLSKLDLQTQQPGSMTRINVFVEQRFCPDVVGSCKPGGQVHYEHLLGKHVLPAIGGLRLFEVKPPTVQMLLLEKLKSGLSVQTCIHIRNVISAIFRHAKRMQFWSGDLPTEGVRLPALQPAERRALSWEQVKLLAACTKRVDLEALVIVLALTGLRIGEALGLRWKRVNLEGTPVVVDGELVPPYTLLVRESYGIGGYGTVKTKTSRRAIPLSSESWYQFSRLKAMAKHGAPDGPVWPARNGKPLDRHNIANRNLKDAAKAAGMPWVSFHHLRHTSATLADQAGLSVTVRQKILGHATPEMTQWYTHSELEGVREGLERISKQSIG